MASRYTNVTAASSSGSGIQARNATTTTTESSEYGSTIKSLYRTIRRLWSSDKDFETSLQNSRSSRPVEPRVCLDLALHTLEVSAEDPSVTLPLDYGLLPPQHLLATPAYLRHTESFSTGPPLDDARCYIVDTVMQSIRMSLLCQTQKEYLSVEVAGTPAPNASLVPKADVTPGNSANLHDPSASASFTASELEGPSSNTGLRILVFGPQSLMRARRIVSSGDPLLPESYSALTRHGKIFNSGVYWTDDLSVVQDVEAGTFDAVLWFDSMLPLNRIAKLHAEALTAAIETEGITNPQAAHIRANQIVATSQRDHVSSTIAALNRVVKPGGILAGTALFSKGAFAANATAPSNERIANATEQANTLVLTSDSVFASLCSARDALSAFLHTGCDVQVFTDLALEGRIVVHHPSQYLKDHQDATTTTGESSAESEVQPSPYAEFQTALLRSGRVQAMRMLAVKPLDAELEGNEFQALPQTNTPSIATAATTAATEVPESQNRIVPVTSSNISPRHACILSIAFPLSGAISSIAIPHTEGQESNNSPLPTTPEEADEKTISEAIAVKPENSNANQTKPIETSTGITPAMVGLAAGQDSNATATESIAATMNGKVSVAGQPTVPIATRPRGLSASVSSPNLSKLLGEEEDDEDDETKPIDATKEPISEQPDPTEVITASGSRVIGIQRGRGATGELDFLPPPLTHVLSNGHSTVDSVDPFAPVTAAAPPMGHPAATPVPQDMAAAMYEAQIAASAVVEPLRVIRRDRLAISGLSVGLPNHDAISDVVAGRADVTIPASTRSVFDKNNLEALFRGENFLQKLSAQERNDIRSKNPFMLLTKDGKRVKKYLTADEQLLGVEGKMGKLDLVREYGVPPFVIEALDLTFQFAIAAGLEALQDAGIQVMGKDAQGRPVIVPLPRNIAEDTGVIFASSFPGLDSLVEETTAAAAHQTRQEILNLLKSRHEAELAQRCAIQAAQAEAASAAEKDQKDGSTTSTAYSIALQELEATTAGPMYEYNRKLLFRVLVMANAQLAELIRARGPNTQVNAACAGTSQALAMADDWIRVGRCSRVVVISADTATSDRLFPYLGTGFLVLGAASIVQEPLEAAAPFDLRRKGMILGAGAVGLVLEKYSSVRMRHAEMVRKARKFEKARSAALATTQPSEDETATPPARPHGVLSVEEALAWKPKAELLGSMFRNSAFHASLIDGDHVSGEMHQFLTLMEQIHGRRLFGTDLAPSPSAYWESSMEKLRSRTDTRHVVSEDHDDDDDVDNDADESDRLAWMHAMPANMSQDAVQGLLTAAESVFENDTTSFTAPKPASTGQASCQTIEATPSRTPFDTLPPIRQLRRARIAQQLIYVAHETGTAACAKVESRAIHDAFGGRFKQQVIFTNTKGFTGHPMSVAFEDVIAAASLHYGKVPPVANLRNPDPALGKIQLSQGGTHDKLLSLRFAAGFGSQFAILFFRKYLAPLNALSESDYASLPKSLPGVGTLDWMLESQDYDEVPCELVESLSATAAKAAQKAARAASPIGPPGSAAQALRVYPSSGASATSPFQLYAKSGVAWVPLVSGRPASSTTPGGGSGLSSAASSFSGVAAASGQFGYFNPFLAPPTSGLASFTLGPEGTNAYYPYAGGQGGLAYGYGSIAGSVAGSVSSMSNGPTSPTAAGSVPVDHTPTTDPMPAPMSNLLSTESFGPGVGATHRQLNSSATLNPRGNSQRGAYRHMEM